ncbi:MAG: SRPBCC family protein [Ignavibacteriae bacterium]|nr:CDP-paratose 2-epimerase [Ignavibacteriota bacterium]NOG99213.1 SRPBCC family protein [Ignavibacteriota bacterium]
MENGKMFNIKSEQIIKLPIEKVFSFFERPENLSLITPKWLKFNILTPEPLVMKSGAIFDYQIKIFGIPNRWKTLITDYDPPYKFVDEQAKGPYKKWIHTHTFEKIEGGTLVTDNVDYDLYGGAAAKIINEIYIKHSVKSIFTYRSKVLNEILTPELSDSLLVSENQVIVQS